MWQGADLNCDLIVKLGERAALSYLIYQPFQRIPAAHTKWISQALIAQRQIAP